MRILACLAAAWTGSACCLGLAAAHAQVIFTFAPPAIGQGPSGSLIMDGTGALYGTASGGGSTGAGTVFKLTPPGLGQGSWTETTLYEFEGGGDGSFPDSGVTMDSYGVLYGITANPGTAFKLTPPTGGQTMWTKSTLATFDVGFASSGLLPGPDGSFYGTTALGGFLPGSTIYQLRPPAGGSGAWAETTLYQFSNGSGGDYPSGPLAIDKDGNLYGTAGGGGIVTDLCSGGCGLVYRLSPPAPGGTAWQFKVLYKFQGGTDGSYPVSGVIAGPHGTLLGTTIYGGDATQQYDGDGIVFQLTPPSVGETEWTETIIQRFAGPPDGSGPHTLLLERNGNLIGTTGTGGSTGPRCGEDGCGTAFELSPPPSGSTYWLRRRTLDANATTGANPQGLSEGEDGNFYIPTFELGPLPKAAGTIIEIPAR